ncbi:MAG: O-antigen ligase family protein [Candidatus Electrothrix sp.]
MSKTKISPDEILLFLLLLFGPLAHGLVETWSITTAHLTVISLISIAVLTRIYKGELKFYRTPTDIPIFFFVLSVLISYGISVYPYASRIIIYKGLTAIALFFYVVNTQRSREKINRLLWVIVILGAMYAVMGLTLIDGDILGFKIFSQKRYNISLFYVNYNHFAGYLEMVFCLSVGLAAASNGGKRILLFGMTVLIAIAMLSTLSRGGIIGLTGGLAFFILASAFMQRQKKGTLLLFSAITIGLIIIAWFGLDPVLKRLSTLDDLSVAGEARIQIWQDTLQMIYDRPFLGWGPGTFSVAFPAYQSQGFNQQFVNYAHNDYLELAADTGIIGLTAFIGGLLSLYIFCLKKLSTARTYWQKIGTGALAACFSILIHSVTDCNLQIPANLFLFATAAGIAVVAGGDSEVHKKNRASVLNLCTALRRRISTVVLCVISCGSLIAVLLIFSGEQQFKKAEIYLGKGQFDNATSAIDNALFFISDNATFASFKGDILLTKAKADDIIKNIAFCTSFKKIIYWYNKGAQTCPTNGEYLHKKAALQKRCMKLDNAEKTYKQAINLYPMHPPTYYNLATVLVQQKHMEQAVSYYRRFLELSGQKKIKKVLDDIWQAGGEYNVQKKAVPETALFRRAFANYLAGDGQYNLAAQEYIRAFSLEPTTQNALAHLTLLWRNKDFTNALKQSDEYLHKFPKEIKIAMQHAAIQEQLHMIPEAVATYRNLLDRSATPKESIQYYIKIASLYRKKKQYSEAVTVLQEATTKIHRAGNLHYHLGLSLRSLKKNEEALAAFKKAVTLSPDNVSFLYQLGVQYERSGLEESAVKNWKMCLSIKPGFTGCEAGIKRIEKKFSLPSLL